MGSTFQAVVDLDATAGEAPALAERVVAWLVGAGVLLPERKDVGDGKGWYAEGPRWAAVTDERRYVGGDGLAAVTGRTVFWSPQGGDAVCPSCAAVLEGRAALFSPAIDAWWRTGEAEVDCPACGRTVPLAAWEWGPDGFAFAYLGFEVWNGPPLRPGFVAEVGRVLGHRVRLVRGKI
ncbi:hypothetical protein ABZ135_15165 [Streptomyces sp. NPDC006339]|uniref:hypothetical protein n=1 Tax=Streptomyces sp. NPDC006339 TaxID=3156755 RepID=UPI0033AA28EF